MVPWLYSYAKNTKFCPGGVEKNISIERRINEYKKNTKKPPIIVFDYKASIQLFTESSKVHSCCAGREKLIREKVENFFKTLTNKFGCKLVFFLDGPIKNHKIPYYEKKSNNKYKKLQTYFNITNGIEMNNTNIPTHTILPIYYDNILEIAKNYGEIHIAFKNENDLDIEKFACDNDVLAIFASDTDFVIMKGDYQIWLPSTINMDNLTIDCLNKNNIRKALRLRENQMPIFATLYGNTIIPSEKIQKLLPSTYQSVVANHIRVNYPYGIKTRNDYQKLSNLLYNNGKNDLTLIEAQTMIRKSLDSYDILKAEENNIEPKWLREHIQITKSAFVYVVHNDILFTIGLDLIHLNMSNTSKQYSELILQLVLRQMGVILKDFENREHIERKIFYKPNHEEPFKTHLMKPYFPNFDLPSVQCILECSEENSLEYSKKIELLSWLVSPTKNQIDSSILRDILDTDYFIPLLVLNYFVREGCFSILEADAVLLTISKSIELTVGELQNYPEPSDFPARPFYVSNVYATSNYYFLNALIVCGLSNYYKGGNFDGFVFHKIYTELLNANENQRMEMMNSLQSYRIYDK